ncbi:MAG: isoprenyl transferase [Alphaproteobacteria bacterium]|nr:isoprenyl transferase [Alphaproteobacteria bacterium]
MPSSAPTSSTHTPPRHVAIIMDGNGRWAKARLLPRVMGHRAGVAAVRTTVRAAADLGIEYLTLYGFSSENWKRPVTEVNDLMGLLRLFIHDDLEELHASGVEIRIIGAKTHLAGDIIELMEHAQARTRGNTKLKLVIAFNYGGQDEIVEAARRIAEDTAAGKIVPQAVDRELFITYLATAGIPDPDLVIRTSGERRLSNFLIWQTAYSEFVFTDTLWPDFTKAHLVAALDEFKSRDRRFGGVSMTAGART